MLERRSTAAPDSGSSASIRCPGGSRPFRRRRNAPDRSFDSRCSRRASSPPATAVVLPLMVGCSCSRSRTRPPAAGTDRGGAQAADVRRRMQPARTAGTPFVQGVESPLAIPSRAAPPILRKAAIRIGDDLTCSAAATDVRQCRPRWPGSDVVFGKPSSSQAQIRSLQDASATPRARSGRARKRQVGSTNPLRLDAHDACGPNPRADDVGRSCRRRAIGLPAASSCYGACAPLKTRRSLTSPPRPGARTPSER